MRTPTISVVIPCHNYGRFLARCVQSVLGQTKPPDEILIVDDASDDDTEAVALRFKELGVRYLRVDYRSPLLTRRAGVENTHGEIVCCIDADDYIDPFYIESGLRYFTEDTRLGIVYSDVEFFDQWSGRSTYPESSETGEIDVQNYIHCGALVRREAVEVAEAFSHGGPPGRHEDWATWKKILKIGFKAIKQEAIYHYRKHQDGLSRDRHYGIGSYTYYEGAALSEEPITLFTPLAGRGQFWERYTEFLQKQLWNHRQIRLILMDTSHDPAFSRMVRRWLAECDYPAVQYIRMPVGKSGLADECRIDEEGHALHDVLKDVRLAMARIYSRLRNIVDTDYLWIVEDDVIPPLDACERMLRSFCPDTVSVSGVVPHRYENGPVAWGIGSTKLEQGEGVQLIGGNGFGCVMLRTSAIKNGVFTSSETHPDYDRAFYASLSPDQLVKLDWSLQCEHLSVRFDREALSQNYVAPDIEESEFDEEYYYARNPDVALAARRGLFSNGYEHYVDYGRAENRAARRRPTGAAAGSDSETLSAAPPSDYPWASDAPWGGMSGGDTAYTHGHYAMTPAAAAPTSENGAFNKPSTAVLDGRMNGAHSGKSTGSESTKQEEMRLLGDRLAPLELTIPQFESLLSKQK